MEGIRQWAFSICAAIVACGIARMLVPKTSLEKIFSLTVSVFFLCCLLSPALLRAPRVSIELREYSQEEMNERARALQEVVGRQQNAAEEESVRKIIAEKLSQMGIKYYSVTIDITTEGQSEAACTATIILDNTHRQDHDRIAERLERELGIQVRLGYQSAEEGEDD